MPSSRSSAVLLLAATLGLAACASTPKAPPPSLNAARAAIDNPAIATDATRYAAMELRTAREKLDLAEAAWRAGDYEDSARLADEALVTARLTETRIAAARAEDARADVARTMQSLQTSTGATGSTMVVPPLPLADPSRP
jgi:hypothetical protein